MFNPLNRRAFIHSVAMGTRGEYGDYSWDLSTDKIGSGATCEVYKALNTVIYPFKTFCIFIYLFKLFEFLENWRLFCSQSLQ